MDDLHLEVERRTSLAFSNQMEMLTFFLTDGQQYGINVFKIIEVLETPRDGITQLPGDHPSIVGAINFRGKVVTVIDVAAALEMGAVNYRQEISYIILCEYSSSTQGLLISAPNKLINKGWEEIKPPGASFASAYLTALSYDEAGHAIQILDVEKLLGEIIGIEDTVSADVVAAGKGKRSAANRVLVVDDSRTARQLIQATLDQLEIGALLAEDAARALEILEDLTNEGELNSLGLIICDIEMPGMDGFTLTRTIKSNAHWSKVPLILHSSMSSQSNRIKAQQVGADDFLGKFQADSLAKTVLNYLKK